MVGVMASNDSIVRYLNPWKHRRELERQQQRVAELRRRDGDDCRRCRRPLRFDFAEGNDHTDEVTERLRRKNEAELFAASRRRKRA